MSNRFLQSHIAYDLGIKKLTKDLAKILNCYFYLGKHSRLIIDLNRGKNDPTLIPEISDRKLIHGNIKINKIERKKRIKTIYNIYHRNISNIIKHRNIKFLISLHSFNPVFKNKNRNIEIGVLSNSDRRLSELIISQLNKLDFKIGDNKPYRGNLIGDSMYKHGLKKKLFHSLIEIRNDLIIDSHNLQRISKTLKLVINNSINKIS